MCMCTYVHACAHVQKQHHTVYTSTYVHACAQLYTGVGKYLQVAMMRNNCAQWCAYTCVYTTTCICYSTCGLANVDLHC